MNMAVTSTNGGGNTPETCSSKAKHSTEGHDLPAKQRQGGSTANANEVMLQ
jgi:hypothetical protein